MSSKRRNGPSAWEARLLGVDWGAASLWLIGLGGVLLVATTVAGGSRPALALTLVAGPITNRDRLRFAGQVVGSALVGVGGVIAMVSKAPPLAFILATVGVALVIGWLALSWRVRQFWLSELGLRRHSWGLACAERCVRWHWCLRHPFNDGADNLWPAGCSDLGPTPPEDLPTDTRRQRRFRKRAMGRRDKRPRVEGV